MSLTHSEGKGWSQAPHLSPTYKSHRVETINPHSVVTVTSKSGPFTAWVKDQQPGEQGRLSGKTGSLYPTPIQFESTF